jgi:hypothetical protein
MASSTAALLRIPEDVIEDTLTLLHPSDVAHFSQICRWAHDLVYGAPDQYLWRQLFLMHAFDDLCNTFNLRHTSISTPYNWRDELQCRVRAELIALNIKHRLDEHHLALDTIVSVIGSAAPVQSGSEYKPSNSLKWVTRILRDSRILDAVPNNQIISRIRTYLALSLDGAATVGLDSIRNWSRCRVYSLRAYRRDNHYGPYLVGGQVDWVQVETLVNVIQINLMELPDVWRDTRPSVGLEATRAYSATGARNRAPADWACVEGTWRRIVCFMDYRYVLLNSCTITLETHTKLPTFQ